MSDAEISIKQAREYLKKGSDKIDLIINAIEADICDRRGLKHEWRSIEQHIIDEEIKPTWREIIQRILNEV